MTAEQFVYAEKAYSGLEFFEYIGQRHKNIGATHEYIKEGVMDTKVGAEAKSNIGYLDKHVYEEGAKPSDHKHYEKYVAKAQDK